MKVNIEQAILNAVEAHKQGNLGGAENIYRAIIELQPHHPDANHNLGVLLAGLGRSEMALPFFKTALISDPRQEQFWTSYLNLLVTLKQYNEVVSTLEHGRNIGIPEDFLIKFEQIIEKERQDKLLVSNQTENNHIRSRINKSNFQDTRKLKKNLDKKEVDNFLKIYQSGDYQSAKSIAEKIVKKYPDHPYGWKVLGVVLSHLDRPTDALLAIEKSLQLDPSDPQAHSNLGNILKNLGNLNESVISYKKAIFIEPAYWGTHNSLACVLQVLGRSSEAEASYREAMRLNPDSASICNDLGVLLQDLARFSEAEELYRRAIEIQPNFAQAHSNLGNVLKLLNRITEAESCYRAAIRFDPKFAQAHNNLGVLLQENKQLVEAKEYYQKALKLNPGFAQAHTNLGNTLTDLGNLEEAEFHHRESLRLNPDVAQTHSNLAITLQARGKFQEAKAHIETSILLSPNEPKFHNNFGVILKALKQYREAEKELRLALQIKPDFAEAYNNLGTVLQDVGKLLEAKDCYQNVIRLDPNHAGAHLNLNNVLRDFCELAESEENCRKSMQLDPTDPQIYGNLLFSLNYDYRRTAQEIFDEYIKYASYIKNLNLPKYQHLSVRRNKEKRIRIGYFSPDFKAHAARFFMEPLFVSHDKNKFELYAYSNVNIPDIHTKRIKKYFDCWVDVFSISDSEMSKRIYDDRIDILVDLAGHTSGNRMPVFAMKPAPIQVTYLIGTGYTSGLEEIDYFFGDENLTPEESDQYFSERIWRLPAPAICYSPPVDNTPEVNEPPLIKNGYVTFGTMSRTVRINDEVLDTWKQILLSVSNSRLRIDQKIFSDPATKSIFLRRMKRLNMPIDRIDLVATNPHWYGYHEIDILLDCFPHNAGTTNIEALWMGIPVITKMDRPSVGRIGAAILAPLELKEWIAPDKQTYIRLAINMANDTDRLRELRRTLRDHLVKSSLLNSSLLTKNIEDAYEKMLKKRFA